MAYWVRNVPDTTEEKPDCGCESWLDHWKRNSRSITTLECMAIGCRENDRAYPKGAHVFVRGDIRPHIVPLCAAHNHPENTEEFEVSAAASPVLAQILPRCPKSGRA